MGWIQKHLRAAAASQSQLSISVKPSEARKRKFPLEFGLWPDDVSPWLP